MSTWVMLVIVIGKSGQQQGGLMQGSDGRITKDVNI